VVHKSDGHPVRSGDSSRRFEVSAGDCSWDEVWNDCKNDRERHELYSTNTFTNSEDWFQWSIFLPKDYELIYPVKVALAQFHQNGSHPVWMFQNSSGGYFVDNQVIGSTIEIKKILTDEDMRGHWTDILVHVKWTSKQNGFFRVYVNGETQPRYTWIGATKEKNRAVYYKVGIYRSFISRGNEPTPTQIVYYDDIARAASCNEAIQHFDCLAIIAGQSKLPKANDIKICDGRICAPTYDRTVTGLNIRFACWLDYVKSNSAISIPTATEVTTLINNIVDNRFYLTRRKLLQHGISPESMGKHSKSVLRLVNYTYTNERFCQNPGL
jgi:hypothetical protein